MKEWEKLVIAQNEGYQLQYGIIINGVLKYFDKTLTTIAKKATKPDHWRIKKEKKCPHCGYEGISREVYYSNVQKTLNICCNCGKTFKKEKK